MVTRYACLVILLRFRKVGCLGSASLASDCIHTGMRGEDGFVLELRQVIADGRSPHRCFHRRRDPT